MESILENKKMIEIKVIEIIDEKIKDDLESFKKDNEDCISDFSPSNFDDKYFDKPYAYVLAYDGEKVVGRVKLFTRAIDYKGVKITLGGVGGVRVRPEYRRHGIAGEMMEEAMDRIQKEGADAVFLSAAERMMSFYNRFGFKKLKSDYKLTGKSGKEYLETGGMVAIISGFENDILETEESFYIGEGTF